MWKFHYATANSSTSHQTSITFPYATEISVAILMELLKGSVITYATPHRSVMNCNEVGFMHLIPGEVHNLSKAIGG